ncbi:AraC family transcriptional regulator [Croceimicrobium hydrocarbonivorans]|uniref:AraC family transcriptional regulator n=1 Tax=Croceimicrobium hydrocarbonivorans TaxID=2761580 RepID=A0A7H0VCN5_9FLAO|nr:helix-turn-helix domain-containing protein [Croceimicrobium hydrocarbonivorans]QNR23483.1 AraC family transcriptional regulator [Croceimicrobium hydrocarbonivorans]
MKELQHLKNLYSPIQPAVKSTQGDLIYLEYKSSEELSDFIYCYWQLKTEKDLSEDFKYRVVSDGCIDLFFNHHKPAESFLMGFCRKYTEFSIGTSFNYIGIRFRPAMFPMLFGINAKSLSERDSELKLHLPALAQWIQSEIKADQSFQTIVDILNTKLKSELNLDSKSYDERFLKSLAIILERKGYLNTETDLDTGLSPRHLQRIFNFYIGTTAKSFSNVVRFQHILKANPSRQSLKRDKLYFDLGFYDQAHFIKSFKTFYGVTPSEAFD